MNYYHGNGTRSNVRGEPATKCSEAMEGMWVQRGIELFEEDPEYQGKLKQFQKWHPTTFRGTQDTKDVNEWIQNLEQIFKVMRCKGHHKVLLATFMLRGEVRSWWKRKEQELNELRQEDMTVDQYKASRTWHLCCCSEKGLRTALGTSFGGVETNRRQGENATSSAAHAGCSDGAADVAAVAQRIKISRGMRQIEVGNAITGDGGNWERPLFVVKLIFLIITDVIR
ncbi:hypothetical protein SLEP1_g50101 [Rubroshorea leprosula]|uniref:Retrotransposon gag domain-containing protein n=1 Tax=Rubroshorea leprosula TaxID=152421 RepID=A0AAV5M182_9ROSI|nr:hypothetical protein SLEP1_g50101 [Rubroshorea leprosula]